MDPNSVPRKFHFNSSKPQNNVPIFLGGIATSAAVASSTMISSLPDSAISQKFKINETRKQLQGPIQFLSQSNNQSSFSTTARLSSSSPLRAPSGPGEAGLMRTFKFNSKTSVVSNIRSNDISAAVICMPREAIRKLSSCSNNACRDSACSKPAEQRRISEDTDDEENSCYSRQNSEEDNRDTSSVEDLNDAFSDIDDDVDELAINHKRHKRDPKSAKKKEDRQRWDADGLKKYAYGKSSLILTMTV